ncbi:MAG: c-type cytochrome [Candidatus Brocadiales bacterium]
MTHFITTLLFLFLVFSFTGERLAANPPKGEGKINAIKVYRNNCKKCHGWDGKRTTRGKALGASDFTNASWQTSISDSEIIEAITNGKKKMPSWKGELSAKEILAVGKFIRSFVKRRRR